MPSNVWSCVSSIYFEVLYTHFCYPNTGAGIATDYGLDGWSSIPGRSKIFPVLHSIQTGFWAHPASYPLGTGATFYGAQAAGA
jgi:hypothetical protein